MVGSLASSLGGKFGGTAARQQVVRFVGGPLHNRHIRVEASRRRYDTEQVVTFELPARRIEARITSYFRCRFVSDYGTKYEQFVHESLLCDGVPIPETYVECFDDVRAFTVPPGGEAAGQN